MDWSGNIKNIYPCPELLYSICVDANDTYLFATIDNYNDLEYSFYQKIQIIKNENNNYYTTNSIKHNSYNKI